MNIPVCGFYGPLVVYKLVSKETFNKNLFLFIKFSYADILCVLDRYSIDIRASNQYIFFQGHPNPSYFFIQSPYYHSYRIERPIT